MSKKFIPPKLDMGQGFATASSMKAKQYDKSNKKKPGKISTPVSGASKRKLPKQKTMRDTVPLSLENLSQYFDWRRGSFDESPTLFTIATVIWQYLPKMDMVKYTVNFADATENKVVEIGMNIMAAPPVICTTSPKGDLVIMTQNMKQLTEYEEKQFLIILYPYIDNCKFIDDASVKTAGGAHCTYWEIDGVEHLTHIVMDKHGIIYFTTGESVYRIMKAEGDMYLDNYEDIFTPSNDTSHITCLWRQDNNIFLTIQDWDNEEALDVYKIRPPKDKGVSTPDSPTGSRGSRSPSFGGGKSPRARTRSRSNSGYGSDYGGSSPRGGGTANDSNEFVTKVRSFTLQFNSRIWQLGTMRFEKKFVLAVGAAQQGSKPKLLQIGFKRKIKTMDMMGGDKKIIWPKSVPDEVPHSIYMHKQTKTWFCILPVTNKKYKDGARLYWIQFKMDKTKKKIIWQRLVPIPDEAKDGEWLYYDDLRDVLIGFVKNDTDANEYVFKFLPDMTKHLWIDFKDDDDKKEDKPGMTMQRSFRRKRKTSREKPSLRRNSSGSNTKTPKLGNTGSGKSKKRKNSATPAKSPSAEHTIKPSKAKGKKNGAVDTKKIKPKKGKKKSEKAKKGGNKSKDKETKSAFNYPKPDKPAPAEEDKPAEVPKKRNSNVDVTKIKPKKKDKTKNGKKNGSKSPVKNGGASPVDKIAAATNALSDVIKPVAPLQLENVDSKTKSNGSNKGGDNKDNKGTDKPPKSAPKSPVKKKEKPVQVVPRRKNTKRKGTRTPSSSSSSPRKYSSSPRKAKKPVMDFEEEDVMD
eukprot:CAMPEP_0201573746 /NCGR_PEP_ID=MMETSP0190_2-20130828/17759_1 /ASSEMBLY_ACC=CAM_ASM_000263 /TAXON_ID=37353 /ORGANISM="Rosalina sp." /LENGTH=798 /DNA_ID=CAMNT_0048001073 /DNA_START=22 /DNA_END=2418 /DNA_ORIENTATION=-